MSSAKKTDWLKVAETAATVSAATDLHAIRSQMEEQSKAAKIREKHERWDQQHREAQAARDATRAAEERFQRQQRVREADEEQAVRERTQRLALIKAEKESVDSRKLEAIEEIHKLGMGISHFLYADVIELSLKSEIPKKQAAELIREKALADELGLLLSHNLCPREQTAKELLLTYPQIIAIMCIEDEEEAVVGFAKEAWSKNQSLREYYNQRLKESDEAALRELNLQALPISLHDLEEAYLKKILPRQSEIKRDGKRISYRAKTDGEDDFIYLAARCFNLKFEAAYLIVGKNEWLRMSSFAQLAAELVQPYGTEEVEAAYLNLVKDEEVLTLVREFDWFAKGAEKFRLNSFFASPPAMRVSETWEISPESAVIHLIGARGREFDEGQIAAFRSKLTALQNEEGERRVKQAEVEAQQQEAESIRYRDLRKKESEHRSTLRQFALLLLCVFCTWATYSIWENRNVTKAVAFISFSIWAGALKKKKS